MEITQEQQEARIEPVTQERAQWLQAMQRGMTLVEILVVLAIIGLVMGGVAVMAQGAFGDAQADTARNESQAIDNSVGQYMVTKRKGCPKDMRELKTAKIIKRVPKDPWGSKWKIVCKDGDFVGVVSAGKDKEFDTKDDIKSWDDEDAGDEEQAED